MPAPVTLEHWRWFHVILGTCGSWLPGDPRGFRTRHHRDHVDGDYKSLPPPGIYESFHKTNQAAMTADAVVLRWPVGDTLRRRLEELHSTVACFAICGQHPHLLAKIDPAETRNIVGDAKKTACFSMRDAGYPERLWANRPKFVPIKNRRHHLNVYHYILRHEEEGAYVWKFSDSYDADGNDIIRTHGIRTHGA